MTLQRLALHTTIVLGTLTGIFLVWQFHRAVVLFLISLIIAAAMRPMGVFFSKRGVPGGAAIILVYIIVLSLLAAFIWWVSGALLNELPHMGDDLAHLYDQAWMTWPQGNLFQQWLAGQMPPPADLISSISATPDGQTLSQVLGFTMNATSVIGESFTVLVLSIYWSIDRVHFERLWLSLLPVESRARARQIWRAIEHDFGQYVRSELLQSVFAGICFGVILWALKIPYATLLAVLAGLLWLIPWFGGLMALLLVGLAGFIQSTFTGVMACALAIGILCFLNLFIKPHFFHQKQISSLFSVLLMIALIEPFGLIGFIISPPLAAVIELVLRYNLPNRTALKNGSSEREKQITALRQRLKLLRERLQENGEAVEPQALSLLDRLEDLAERTDEILENSANRAAIY